MIKYVIGHWTAGNPLPNSTDLSSYQLLIDGRGALNIGKPQGKTASTGGMNSITYNISCCGGGNVKLNRVQMEGFYKICASVIRQYDLSVNDFYTHAEIGEMCKDGSITKLLPYNKWLYQNKGKIDLTELPDIKGTAKETGDFIRSKIRWYIQNYY